MKKLTIFTALVLVLCLLCACGSAKDAGGKQLSAGSDTPVTENGFRPIEAVTVAPFDPVAIDPDDVSVSAGDPAEIDGGDSSSPAGESFTVAPMDPVTIEIPTYSMPGIEIATVGPMDPVIIDIPTYEFPEIEITPVTPMGPIEITIPTFTAPEIEIQPAAPLDPVTFDFSAFRSTLESSVAPADAAAIDDLSEEELLDIAETRQSLLDSIRYQLDELGIGLMMDPDTGVISLDTSILFAGDSAELSDTGKAFLKMYVWSYAGVVTDPAFDGFISAVLVEGHTAPLSGSTYESGLPLSEERADVVLKYCLSDEVGLPAAERAALEDLLQAVGLSNSDPVRNADGTVNLEASRRVTFRFLVNIG